MSERSPLPEAAAAALDRLALFGTRLGLERFGRLLEALGSPQRGLPAVLVAGTNGKGTVAALVASFLQAGHVRTGLYVSPHLESVEERLRLDGVAIDGEVLAGLLDRVLAAGEEVLDEPPTYFEALTACAFLWFAESRVEVAVLEVGLGGRLDATNLAEPVLSIITSIGLDHREHLGDTLDAIAREKAGILRPGVQALSGVDPVGSGAEAAAALAAEAERVGAPLTVVPEVLRVDAIQRAHPFATGDDGEDWRQRVWLRRVVDGLAGDTEVFELPFAGRHQAENLAVAVEAARCLKEGVPRPKPAGSDGAARDDEGDGAGDGEAPDEPLAFDKLTPRRLEKGSRACRWPGRLEEVRIDSGNAGDARRVLLDVAHNPAGAEALAAHLVALAHETGGSPVDLVFGILTDKDAEATLAPLLPHVGRLVFTRPDSDRARDPAELAALATWEEEREARVEADPARALAVALERAGERIVLVCGSLALVGPVRRELRRRFGVPEATVDLVVG